MSDPLPATIKSEIEELRCHLEMALDGLTRLDPSDPEATEIFEDIRTNIRAAIATR